MRFRSCVGTFMLMSVLAACGSRSSGGFHPSGQAMPTGGSATGATAGGAGSGGDTSAGTTDTEGTAPRTPQSALAAYRGFQAAYERAYANNDPGLLAQVAMDPLLQKLSQDMAGIRARGLIWRFHNVVNPRIQGGSSDGSSVVILDCVRTLGAYKYDAGTGRRLGSWRGGTFEYQAVMRYADGAWKISDATRSGTC